MRLAAECVIWLLWLRLLLFGVVGVLAARWPLARGLPLSSPLPGRVVVVVPAFDEAACIGTTLAALLAQTRRADEIVVVDDGSRDATAAIAQQVLAGVAGARVLRLPANQGKAAALNAGIAASEADIVATVDADTRLAPDALAAALQALGVADAVAFVIDVDSRGGGLIERLQRQEYAAALDAERQAQAVFGAVAILPGAASLFRRAVLPTPPFSNRTCTEDADLTLGLARRGARIRVAPDARAFTVVPAGWRLLAAQRLRWTTGHLQCLGWQLRPGPAHGRFVALTLPNFALATGTPMLGLAALAVLAWADAPADHGLGLGIGMALAGSASLVYLQRALASTRLDLAAFVLEPLVSGTAGCALFMAALLRVLRIPTAGPKP